MLHACGSMEARSQLLDSLQDACRTLRNFTLPPRARADAPAARAVGLVPTLLQLPRAGGGGGRGGAAGVLPQGALVRARRLRHGPPQPHAQRPRRRLSTTQGAPRRGLLGSCLRQLGLDRWARRRLAPSRGRGCTDDRGNGRILKKTRGGRRRGRPSGCRRPVISVIVVAGVGPCRLRPVAPGTL
jgi:hypothetical protein